MIESDSTQVVRGDELLRLATKHASEGRELDAAEAFWKLSGEYPNLREPAHNAGHHWRSVGCYEQSLEAFQRALSASPWAEDAQLEVATALSLCGKHEESLETFAALLLSAEDSTRYLNAFGHALVRAGRVSDAVGSFQKAYELDPSSTMAGRNLAVALYQEGRTADARVILERLVRVSPSDLDLLRLLAQCLRDLNLFGEAGAIFLKLAEMKPGCAPTQVDLGGIYARIGQLDAALVCFQRALEIDPEHRPAFDNVLGSVLCLAGIAPDVVAGLFRKSARFYRSGEFEFQRGGATPYRIGFVSSDFCRHPVASFLLPLIQNLDRTRFSVFCYSNGSRSDSVTTRIRTAADVFRSISDLSDEEASRLIRGDGVDVLVDLAAHFAGSRLGIFRLRAAPVQVTMIGCMFTTGIPEMDYRITDEFLDPVGRWDEWSVERLVRFEGGAVCVAEPETVVEVGESPCSRDGYITFGSFNNLAKVSASVIDAWAAVLRAVPTGRFVAVAEEGSQLLENLVARGVDSARITLLDRMPEDEYLLCHQRVDVLLDTFPYNGFTVTLLGAWMGVPCLTIEGELPTARAAANVMRRLGLADDFVAVDEADFVRKAARISNQGAHLREIRRSLRASMMRTWMDGRRYAAEFMRWVESLVPVHGLPVLKSSSAAVGLGFLTKLSELERDAGADFQALIALAGLAAEVGFKDRAKEIMARVPVEAPKDQRAARMWIDLLGDDCELGTSDFERVRWTRELPEFASRYLNGCSGDVSEEEEEILRVLCEQFALGDALLCVQVSKRLRDAKHASCAESLLRGFIDRNDRFAEVLVELSDVLAFDGRFSEALGWARQGYALKAANLEFLGWCGVMFYETGRNADAVKCFVRSLRAIPDSESLWLARSLAEEKQGKWTDAMESVQEALRLNPSSRGGMNHRGWCELRIGRPDLAMKTFREAIKVFPEDKLLLGNYLYCLNYPEDVSDEELFHEHHRFERYARKVVSELGNIDGGYVVRGGRIRVGFISPDFFDHSVAHFLIGLLENLDRSRFEIYCYHCTEKRDEFTAKFEALSDGFRFIQAVAVKEAVELIRADGLQVACDLAGHTGDNRLELFAFRLAPVQITMIGAMQTTGLSEMDYRLTDEWMDPEGLNESLHSERLLRFSSGGWSFRPPSDMPKVSDLPALRNGYLTFATFNNLAKCNRPVIDTWAAVLEAVPDSRIMIVAFDANNAKQELIARGIDEHRIVTFGRSAGMAYYRMHDEADVALDTFPFNGLTVTCFAAWMGVPTLGFTGRRPASRVGYSIASRLGLADVLIASSREELSAKARALACNLEGLAQIRREMRARMSMGVANPVEWTREFEQRLMQLIEG